MQAFLFERFIFMQNLIPTLKIQQVYENNKLARMLRKLFLIIRIFVYGHVY